MNLDIHLCNRGSKGERQLTQVHDLYGCSRTAIENADQSDPKPFGREKAS